MTEVHLFIIWSKGIYQKDRILKDLSDKFIICSVYNVAWSKQMFSNNLSRFYGENLPKNSKKEKHCGTDTFCCVIVKDSDPKYDIRNTNKGLRLVNSNIFDSKKKYRSWTNGNKIHATDNIEETKLQLALLFSKDYNDYLNHQLYNKKEIDYKEDIAGSKGWKNFNELFDILNLTCNYVVLRNFENLDEQLNSKHPDVDLLTDDLNLIIDVLNASKTKVKKYRVQYSVLVSGKKINFDLRHVGDNYYDKKWQYDILSKKNMHQKNFFVPDNTDLLYSMMYHALKHKPSISEDYFSQFLILSKKLNFNLNYNDMTNIKLLDNLLEYMNKNNYDIVEPNDISVFFNDSLIKKRIFVTSSLKRLRHMNYIYFRSFTKRIVMKIFKKFRFD